MHGLMYCEKLLHPLMLLLENIQVCSALLTKKSIIFLMGSCPALLSSKRRVHFRAMVLRWKLLRRVRFSRHGKGGLPVPLQRTQ